MRKKININENWEITRCLEDANSKISHSKDWKRINLPHTWNAQDGSTGNEYLRGAFLYRKVISFTKDDLLNRIYIEFEGSNSVTDVYVNEEHVGQHRGGFSTFRFDISPYLVEDEDNILLVKVDNSDFDDVYPKRADFTFFGGIYRDVNIISVPSVHIDLMDYGSEGVYVTQKEVTRESALIAVKTKLTNLNLIEEKVRVWVQVLDKDKKIINQKGRDVFIPSESTIENKIEFIIDDPILWEGLDNPYLYNIKVSIEKFNDVLDEINISTGLRYFSVDPDKGFFLNGKRNRLKGVARHQDKKDKGWAIDKNDQIEDMEIIKEVGANSIRLAHYQHSQFFYNLCDKEGMIIWAEIPFITEVASSENPGDNALQQMIELIRQNYNHPSIFFWGVMNEIQIDQSTDEIARGIVKKLVKVTKEEDPYRQTALANLFLVENQDPYNSYTDLVGYNKYDGWYTGKVEDFAEWCDTFHEENPRTALGITEYGAEGIIEYHSGNPIVKDYSEEYHALFHEKVWKIFESREYLWGTYVWNMFDFGANVRDEGGVKGRNNKGLVTYDRKVKKDAFYMYKAHWSKDPFVHIAGRRFIERPGNYTNIKVYTNCSDIVLYIDGEEVKRINNGSKVIEFKNTKISENETCVEVRGRSNEDIITDKIYISSVSELPKYYEAPDSDGDSVMNWFEQPLMDEEEIVAPVEIPKDAYSTKETLKELMNSEETRQAVISVLGDLRELPMFNMMKGMSVDTLASMDNGNSVFNDKRINKLNQKLVKIKK